MREKEIRRNPDSVHQEFNSADTAIRTIDNSRNLNTT